MFIRIIKEELIIITLYINDILVPIKIEDLIKKIKNQIKNIFKIKDSNKIKSILDIQIYRIKNKFIIKQT